MAELERELHKLLVDIDCNFRRKGKGDYEIWHSPVSRRYFAVGNTIKLRDTANEILKQAGLKKMF